MQSEIALAKNLPFPSLPCSIYIIYIHPKILLTSIVSTKKMSSKTLAFSILLLLLLVNPSRSSRPHPGFSDASRNVGNRDDGEGVVDESCEGIEKDEECLMRRTLAAHTDYIYTQKHNP